MYCSRTEVREARGTTDTISAELETTTTTSGGGARTIGGSAIAISTTLYREHYE